MIKLIGQEWCSCAGSYRNTYVMDSASEKADLPECGAGSIAYVATAGLPAYMVNASGEWVEV